MNSPEEAILKTESGYAVAHPLRQTPDPETSMSNIQASPVNLEYGRCQEHQVRNCLSCLVKERNAAAQALKEARAATPAVPASPSAQHEQVASTKIEPSPAGLNPDSPASLVVTAAEEYARAMADHDRAQHRLVGLQLTVESDPENRNSGDSTRHSESEASGFSCRFLSSAQRAETSRICLEIFPQPRSIFPNQRDANRFVNFGGDNRSRCRGIHGKSIGVQLTISLPWRPSAEQLRSRERCRLVVWHFRP